MMVQQRHELQLLQRTDGKGKAPIGQMIEFSRKDIALHRNLDNGIYQRTDKIPQQRQRPSMELPMAQKPSLNQRRKEKEIGSRFRQIALLLLGQ